MKFIMVWLILLQGASFKETQRKNSRVQNAYTQKESVVQGYFKDKGIDYKGFHIFLRAFKEDQQLEVWTRKKDGDTYTLLHTYVICASSGTLGPKRKEGDLQVPEGVYHINHFNPQSNFYLSLGVSYPNASDKILSDPRHPGGAIYVHGNCVTIGCIPITDDKIMEVYVMAVEARNNGQANIPIHIFPTRLSASALAALKKDYAAYPGHIPFWENLKSIYDDFETTKKLKAVKVNSNGGYYF